MEVVRLNRSEFLKLCGRCEGTGKDDNPHKQRLLGFFKRRRERTERDVLRIDFYRECYGNYSPTSTECPFCLWGLDCEQKGTVKNKFGGV